MHAATSPPTGSGELMNCLLKERPHFTSDDKFIAFALGRTALASCNSFIAERVSIGRRYFGIA